jgi:hypothetical protein
LCFPALCARIIATPARTVASFAGHPKEDIVRRTVRLAALIAALVLAAIPVSARIMRNTIGETATLIGHGHVAKGTVLLECDTPGEQLHFTLTLTQDGASGTGSGAGVCTGGLTEYEVTVPAAGDTFTAGLAEACATADNYHRGVLVDSKQWCRAAGVVLD